MRSGDSLKYTGTVTAPEPLMAKSAVCHSGRLAENRPTRSPGFTPSSTQALERTATRPRNSSGRSAGGFLTDVAHCSRLEPQPRRTRVSLPGRDRPEPPLLGVRRGGLWILV